MSDPMIPIFTRCLILVTYTYTYFVFENNGSAFKHTILPSFLLFLHQELRAGESQVAASVGRGEGPREEVERATVAIGSGRGGTDEGPDRRRLQRAIGAASFPWATPKGDVVVDVNYKCALPTVNHYVQAHADRGEEMTHWKRKAETSEKEVKRLRARIEELKKELARAEDQMDESANSIR